MKASRILTVLLTDFYSPFKCLQTNKNHVGKMCYILQDRYSFAHTT